MDIKKEFEATLNVLSQEHQLDGGHGGFANAIKELMRSLNPDDLRHLVEFLMAKIEVNEAPNLYASVLGDLGNPNWYPDEYDTVRQPLTLRMLKKLKPTMIDTKFKRFGRLPDKQHEAILKLLLRLRCQSVVPDAVEIIENQSPLETNILVPSLVNADSNLYIDYASKIFAQGLDPQMQDEQVVNMIPSHLGAILDEKPSNVKNLLGRLIEATSKIKLASGNNLKAKVKMFVEKNPVFITMATPEPEPMFRAVHAAVGIHT